MSQADHPSSGSPCVGELELKLVLLQNLTPPSSCFCFLPAHFHRAWSQGYSPRWPSVTLFESWGAHDVFLGSIPFWTRPWVLGQFVLASQLGNLGCVTFIIQDSVFLTEKCRLKNPETYRGDWLRPHWHHVVQSLPWCKFLTVFLMQLMMVKLTLTDVTDGKKSGEGEDSDLRTTGAFGQVGGL